MAVVDQVHGRDLDALDQLIAVQEAALVARTRRSHELHVEASAHLPGWRGLVLTGRPSGPDLPRAGRRQPGVGRRRHRVRRPPRRLRHEDGRPRPPGGRARRPRGVTQGTHFAQPTPDIIPVAAELARRVALALWRFTNSSTESTTAAAIHLMRVVTGRTHIIKVEGSYHGHPYAAQMSVYPAADESGPPDQPARCRAPGPARPPRPDRRDDHRAGDDEHRCRPAATSTAW
jgi:glutamate-1-semialdehyde 2,1-aminomutase